MSVFKILAVSGLAATSQAVTTITLPDGSQYVLPATITVTANCDNAAHNFVLTTAGLPTTASTAGIPQSMANEMCTSFGAANTGAHACSVNCGASEVNKVACYYYSYKGTGQYCFSYTCQNGQMATTTWKAWECGGAPSCFPGEAMVHIEGAGETRISELRVGERVLSARGYEPVLGFLHQVSGGSSSFLTVSHSDGEFRATENHLVFTAEGSKAVGDLRVGEQLLPASQILGVRESKTNLGVFSPLTASGTVVVDGVEASIYGQPSMRGKLTHGSAHAAFFPVRAYHALGLARVFGHSHKDELHPFAELLFPLQLLLSK